VTHASLRYINILTYLLTYKNNIKEIS